MSVVRIPQPEDDAFPWPRVAVACALGVVLGLGLAYCGMERDRTAELVTDDGPPAQGSPAVDETQAIQPTGPEAIDASHGEADAAVDTPDAGADAGVDAWTEPVEVAGTTTEVPPTTSTAGQVTLRRGRVAYLRCDGVPQREGPFPCPRDEPLEEAVWTALGEVERCARSLGAGQADIVVDFDAAPVPTVRARDTFPADTPRTDDSALLACTSAALTAARSTLSPSRLIVSFRLTLDPAEH